MIGVVLALLAALFNASSTVLVRKKLHYSRVLNVAFATIFTSNLVLWPLALLFTDLRTVKFEGVLFFAIAGMLAPGIGRLLFFKGIEVLGVSVNAAIIATYPLYSSIFAVLFLNETLSAENWIGILCIVTGVVFIGRRSTAPKIENRRFFKRNLIIPVVATLILSSAAITRKHGLSIYNEPLLGVAIGYASAFPLYLMLLIFSDTKRSFSFLMKDLRLFWKAGAGFAIGWILSYYALSHERVSIVAPLMQTDTLFIFFFVYLYLKELEHISSKLVIGSILIIFGVMLVGIR